MTDDILFFVKFGEKKYMERLATLGKAYFNLATPIREIERENGRGQGDAYEALLQLTCNSVYFENENGAGHLNVSRLNIKIGVSDMMPFFCLTAVRATDCIAEGGMVRLKPEVEEKIRHDFQKADTAVVFYEPSKFMRSMEGISGGVVHRDVQYFDFANRVNSLEFIDYLGRDANLSSGIIMQSNIFLPDKPEELDRIVYITTCNQHNILFCKDLYFRDEREYRFVLTDLRRENAEEYAVDFSDQRVAIFSLNDFFAGIKI